MRKRSFASALLGLCAAWLLGAGCAHSTRNLTAVQDFELNRYLGTWHELARYPHSFENGLTEVRAEYSLRPDGLVQVVNHGYNAATSQWKSAQGKAKFAHSATVGELKVSFFGPFYADYRIVALDPEYQFAIVTGSTYAYFWLLARNPHPAPAELELWLQKAEQLGFHRTTMTNLPP